MNPLTPGAEQVARTLLEQPLPRRWAHVQGVAARARSLAPVLGEDADLLEAAAWLHDIGYAPGLVATGFHPLDSARYLRDAQQTDVIEADERGRAEVLEFQPVPHFQSSVLTYCDMTTSPDGEPVPAERRLAEIQDRPDGIALQTRRAAPTRSWSWPGPGPGPFGSRNGPQDLFEVFEVIL